MSDGKRIYVVIPATVEVRNKQYVVQPPGRQIAQACHVVSKLRFEDELDTAEIYFVPSTTIILAARDSEEMIHVHNLLVRKGHEPVFFSDENEAAYGNFKPITAMAVYMLPKKTVGILDYLPLWGSQ